jgi:peptide subunit release factor RF-3
LLDAARQEISDRFGPIEEAVIQYPSPFVENGVELVDTPGLEESYARTRRVLEALPTADAVILVLDAVQLLNQKEIHFIEQYLRPLGLHKRIFFLINRWNLVAEMAIDPNDPGEVEKIAAEQMKIINTRLVPFVSAAGRDQVAKRIFKVNALNALRERPFQVF